MTKLTALCITVLVLTAASIPARAGIISFEAIIDGAQANAGAGTGSTATGVAAMTLDDSNNLFSWDISWSGLLGQISVAHFHGPAAAGGNAGVVVNFGAISGLTSPSIGSTTITDTQAADLLAGLWYVNIHSDRNPGGEIRGQVLRVSAPAPALMVACGLLLMASVAGRRS